MSHLVVAVHIHQTVFMETTGTCILANWGGDLNLLLLNILVIPLWDNLYIKGVYLYEHVR